MIYLLGDIHGDVDAALSAYSRLESDDVLIQMGDCGFADAYEQLFAATDPKKFKVLGGNHDHPALFDYEHFLGDFGLIEHPKYKIGFCRGAYSIDKNLRIEGRDWWPEEELSRDRANEFLDFYVREKPTVMLTHAAPLFCLPHLVSFVHPVHSFTEQLFEYVWHKHQPALWIHAHYHVSHIYEVDGTRFVSLNVKEFAPLSL
jgi:hypothetical protein